MSFVPKYYLTDKLAKGQTSIKLSTHINKSRFWYGIGLSIFPELWNSDTMLPTTSKRLINKYGKIDPEIDTHLSTIKSRIENINRDIKKEIDRLESESKKIDLNDLKEKLDKKYRKVKKVKQRSKELDLTAYINRFVEDIDSGKRTYTTKSGILRRYSKSTVKEYTNWKTQYQGFQKDQMKKYNFNDIDMKFYKRYVDYFTQKDYTTNSIGKQVKNLKAVMNAAYEDGLHANLTFKNSNFKTLKGETKDVYLTQDEVNELYKLKLRDNPIYDLVRDVFLCGCYTALRYSDYSRIKPIHIKKGNGIKTLEMITQKTRTKVIIPIRPELDTLLKKYNYKLPKTYEQKVNEHIKEICKLAKIDSKEEKETVKGGMTITTHVPKYKRVVTHTARRTGATLMYKANIPTVDIMKITGHTTENNLLKYIKVSKEETAKRLSLNPFFSGAKMEVV